MVKDVVSVCVCVCVCTMEYYSAKKKKNEILPFAKTWVDLGGIMLSEISHADKDNAVCFHICVESKK